MARNPVHSMLSKPSHDERVMQQFVYNLKQHIRNNIQPGNRAIYETCAKPAFTKECGEVPSKSEQIARIMKKQPQYQLFSAIKRSAQELMWESLVEPIYRNQGRLSESYRRTCNHIGKKGSVSLQLDFKIPRGIATVDIHLQPGGFAADYGEDDVLAGALHEAGTNLYSMSGGIGTSESKAEVVMRFMAQNYPKFTPTRILDFGCSSGPSSTPWALAYPDAEVHAIDVGAAMLRYGHARAEALGARVHFHQMDAANTAFKDESFDLVVSHNGMHEMSQKTTEGMFRESYRLLKPGGITIHQDIPLRFSELDAFAQFDNSWDRDNNGELYWVIYANNDPMKMLLDAGFPENSIWTGKFAQLDQTIRWFISTAQKII
ncbi:MAG: class I SAM-dependent methyltransferase [Rhodospirillaceae bacterium]